MNGQMSGEWTGSSKQLIMSYDVPLSLPIEPGYKLLKDWLVIVWALFQPKNSLSPLFLWKVIAVTCVIMYYDLMKVSNQMKHTLIKKIKVEYSIIEKLLRFETLQVCVG